MFSIYILTYNEEIDIAECIESAQGSDDIIVVDSLSRDRTVEIARSYGVRVEQHAFESHGKQRTWMLQSIPTQYEWVYILEADERMTPELFAECLAATQQEEFIGYYVAERVMFMERWKSAAVPNTPGINCAYFAKIRSGSTTTDIRNEKSVTAKPRSYRKPIPTTPVAKG